MINLQLSWDQTEKIVMETLQEDLRIEFELRLIEGHTDNEDKIEAYKLVLSDYMTAKDFQEFMHNLAKSYPKYNSKRLTEANNGL